MTAPLHLHVMYNNSDELALQNEFTIEARPVSSADQDYALFLRTSMALQAVCRTRRANNAKVQLECEMSSLTLPFPLQRWSQKSGHRFTLVSKMPLAPPRYHFALPQPQMCVKSSDCICSRQRRGGGSITAVRAPDRLKVRCGGGRED